jgi:hypothetical protein
MVEKTASEKTPLAGASKAAETAASVSAATAAAVSEAEEPRKKKKKRKKKYSSGTRDAQKLERAFNRAAGRIARAVSVGLETYNEESDRSARKKKDGAVRKALVNASMGIGDALQQASRAPRELAKGIPSGMMWRQMRSVARVVLPPS